MCSSKQLVLGLSLVGMLSSSVTVAGTGARRLATSTTGVAFAGAFLAQLMHSERWRGRFVKLGVAGVVGILMTHIYSGGADNSQRLV